VGFLRLTSPEMGPVFEISGTERHQRRRESKRKFALFVREVEQFETRRYPVRRGVLSEKISHAQNKKSRDRISTLSLGGHFSLIFDRDALYRR
jgi:hypothetical protein